MVAEKAGAGGGGDVAAGAEAHGPDVDVEGVAGLGAANGDGAGGGVHAAGDALGEVGVDVEVVAAAVVGVAGFDGEVGGRVDVGDGGRGGVEGVDDVVRGDSEALGGHGTEGVWRRRGTLARGKKGRAPVLGGEAYSARAWVLIWAATLTSVLSLKGEEALAESPLEEPLHWPSLSLLEFFA